MVSSLSLFESSRWAPRTESSDEGFGPSEMDLASLITCAKPTVDLKENGQTNKAVIGMNNIHHTHTHWSYMPNNVLLHQKIIWIICHRVSTHVKAPSFHLASKDLQSCGLQTHSSLPRLSPLHIIVVRCCATTWKKHTCTQLEVLALSASIDVQTSCLITKQQN